MSKYEVIAQIELLMQSLVDDHGGLIVTCIASFYDGIQDERSCSSAQADRMTRITADEREGIESEEMVGEKAFAQLRTDIVSGVADEAICIVPFKDGPVTRIRFFTDPEGFLRRSVL